VRFPLAAALQCGFCAACCRCMRGLACAARRDAAVAAEARRLCRAAEHAKQLLVAAGGAAGGAAVAFRPGLCDAAAMELLLPLSCALACFVSVRGDWWAFGRGREPGADADEGT
jgi:hypothetical protein